MIKGLLRMVLFSYRLIKEGFHAKSRNQAASGIGYGWLIGCLLVPGSHL